MFVLKKVYPGNLLQVATQNVMNEERLTAWKERKAAQRKEEMINSSRVYVSIEKHKPSGKKRLHSTLPI